MSHLITIAGLGPGSKEMLPLGVWEELRQAERIYLRTARHPLVPWLLEQGLAMTSFDAVYDEEDSFAAVYRRIADAVLEAAEACPVLYAVPGHPLVAEDASRLIIEKARERGVPVRVLTAMSFLDPLFTAAGLDPASGVKVLDALALDRQFPDPGVACVLMQVHDRLVASDVKLRLMERYPETHPVTVVRAAGVPGEERVERVPLFKVDRLPWIDHLTSFCLPPSEEAYSFESLVHIMAALRAENGCPWDREQDHHTLKRYLIEETYEVIEAINEGDMHSVCEELGDLLLQIVFHAQIAKENGFFNVYRVIKGICEKMIHRHPHVFGETKVSGSEEVLRNWEKIKQKEKRHQSSCLAGVPKGLPSLLRAEQVQAKVARVGFDWPDHRGALDKVLEEERELRQALRVGSQSKIAEELGDLLFAVVNVARLKGINAEEALSATVDKFVRRFGHIEDKVRAEGMELGRVSLETMDEWWEEAKNLEK